MATGPQKVVPLPARTGCSREEYCNAMRQLAGGVAIVTTGQGEARTGLTATSLTSLSADPPGAAGVHQCRLPGPADAARKPAFAVSILAQDQQHIADRFAGRCGAHGNARYAGARWSTLVTGSALLDGGSGGARLQP